MRKYGVWGVAVLVALLAGCQSVSKEEESYRQGMRLIEQGSYPQAIGVLTDLGDYKESRSAVARLRYLINGDYIGAGNSVIAAIKSDGTVVYTGGYEDSKSAGDWKQLTALSTDGEYMEGLDANGKLSTTSPWTSEQLQASTVGSTSAMSLVIEAMPKLEHILAFDGNYPANLIALLENGAVKVVSASMVEEDIAAAEAWVKIVSVANGGHYVAGLHADGTVSVAGNELIRVLTKDWKDIVAITSSGGLIGLKEDGTVVAAGDNRFGECNVDGWNDIVAIAAGDRHTVGLRSDGTVISTGSGAFGQRDIEDWKDIVAIDASEYFTLGLKRDGTLAIAGDNSTSGGAKPDIADISGLLVPTVPGM
ncbi:RCC1 domain-containing protein [Cohnella cholangitidis]|uniref:Uncharacterized protein n=1 Tax=Cohnella cholangitidis TaxID=2598458 RepID=A0A7G5C5R1_9BACL|nr:hypothetical protein [Cohnella cholangitidis]QMV44545.1 hypothetical protein FPL14_27770 [Cohnella cholangitidis]